MALYDNFSSDGLDIEVHDGEEFQGQIISKDHYLLYATVGKNWASAQIPKDYYNNPDAINSAVLSIKNKITKLLATDTNSIDNFVTEVNNILGNNKGANRFQELVDLCKGDVYVFANNHRSNYQSIEEYVGNQRKEIAEDIWTKIIDTQRIYLINAYPITPVGFFTVFHYDFNKGVEQMIKIIKENA